MTGGPEYWDLYRQPAVRRRMLEFLGGTTLANATAVYLALGTDTASHHLEPRPVSELDEALRRGLDLSRSLWDRRSLLAHLDLDYVNHDRPAEIYLNPDHCFAQMKPVADAIEAWLRSLGLRALHLLSGRGHHYVWRIRQDTPEFQRLSALGRGRVPSSLLGLYARPHPPVHEAVEPPQAEAFLGLGLIMEYLAGQVKQQAREVSPLPVELTALHVGPGSAGRVMLSLDISEYGDPLHVRVIRMPFSVYHKPTQQRHAFPDRTPPEKLAPWFVIPAANMSWNEGIHVMRNPREAGRLASSVRTRIPETSRGMARLLADYERSPVRDFHDWYYAEQPHPPAAWPRTYDRTPAGPLPGCVRFILAHPNDLLLKLSCLQRIVRVFLSLGWHPRHIAGLIQSIYERDHGWGDHWHYQDPAWRADFYSRMFAGLIVTGADHLVDFNCRSAQEEELCFVGDCHDNLYLYRQSLIERKNHERLARRPIHRLFLPETHS